MNKKSIGALVFAAALCGGPALAAQTVANTSQKGSLLVFPTIDIDPGDDAADTIIEISNDQASTVHVECYYVNQKKGRVNFDFDLTAHAAASWDVGTTIGNIAPAIFPSDVGIGAAGKFDGPGNVNEGELVCFATTPDQLNQIAFNHLTGTATVVFQDDADARGTRQAFRYNAWSFAARGTSTGGLASDNTIQGAPGSLQLTGGGAGTYDACPLYNVSEFNPNGASLFATGGPVTTLDNDLWVSTCNQDLTEAFKVHRTKLLFTIWNANENSLTGAFACIDSTQYVPLSRMDVGTDTPPVTNVRSFDFTTVKTQNAQLRAQGIASAVCPGSEKAGLVAVITSSLAIDSNTAEDAELGSTTFGAGAQSGFVLWEPGTSAVARPQH